MKLSTALGSTGAVLLFTAVLANDGQKTFGLVITLGVASLICFIAAELAYQRDRPEEDEEWKIRDESMS